MKRRILKWCIALLSLLVLQTLTYLTIGPRLLKNELLPNYFATLNHNCDSIFVRDFFVTNCPVGINTYISHNLKEDSEFVKQKFNVDYVHYDIQEHFSWDDTTEKKYNLVYYTWASRSDKFTLFGIFGVIQSETLIIANKHFYRRDAEYHWLLFFWVQTFEFLESTDINHDTM